MKTIEMMKAFESKKLDPKIIFESASVLGCLRATAKVISKRYDVPLQVNTEYLPNQDIVAETNNKSLNINTGNSMTTSIFNSKGLNEAGISLIGLVGHELGHVLFTDFDESTKVMDAWKKGTWYPVRPVFTEDRYAAVLDAVEPEIAKSPSVTEICMNLFHQISNIGEDGYIEKQMKRLYPGTVKIGLEILNTTMFNDQMKDLKKMNGAKSEELLSLMLYAVKTGKKVPSPDPSDDLLMLYQLSDCITATNSARERTNLYNKIFIVVLASCLQEILGAAKMKDMLNQMAQKNQSSSQNANSNAQNAPQGSQGKGGQTQQGGASQGSQNSQGTQNTQGAGNQPKQGTSQSGQSSQSNQNNSNSQEEQKEQKEQQGASGSGEKEKQQTRNSQPQPSQPNQMSPEEIAAALSKMMEKAKEIQEKAIENKIKDASSRTGAGKLAEAPKEKTEKKQDPVMAKVQVEAAMLSAVNEACKDPNLAEQVNHVGTVQQICSEAVCHKGIECDIIHPNKNEGYYQAYLDSVSKISKRTQRKVRDALMDRAEGGEMRDLMVGPKVVPASEAHHDGKIFAKDVLPEDIPPLAVALLIDQSGSMCGTKIQQAAMTAVAVESFCRGLGIPISITGHCEVFNKVCLTPYVRFGHWSDRANLGSLTAGGCNRDGFALRYVQKQISERPEEKKLVILISDGQPNGAASKNGPAYEGRIAYNDLAAIKKDMKRHNIGLIVAAIDQDKEAIRAIYGDDSFLDITDLDDLPKTLTKVILKQLF